MKLSHIIDKIRHGCILFFTSYFRHPHGDHKLFFSKPIFFQVNKLFFSSHLLLGFKDKNMSFIFPDFVFNPSTSMIFSGREKSANFHVFPASVSFYGYPFERVYPVDCASILEYLETDFLIDFCQKDTASFMKII